MTDTELAAQLQEVKHRQELNESSTRQTLEVLASSMQSIQADQRAMVNELKNVSSLSTTVDRMRDDLGKMRDQMLEQNNRVETWFSEQEARVEARLSRWETERDRWRTAHESDNRIGFEQTETKRVALEGQVGSLRENQRYAAGWLKGLAAVGALLIGAVVLIFNDRFLGVQNGFADIRISAQRTRDDVETQRDDLHEIKLYLARGGERRNAPYVPTPKENTDAE